MSLETLRNALLCCALLNLAILTTWNLLSLLPHGWLYRLWSRRVGLTDHEFDALNASGIVLYKLAFLLFNLVPYFALLIMG